MNRTDYYHLQPHLQTGGTPIENNLHQFTQGNGIGNHRGIIFSRINQAIRSKPMGPNPGDPSVEKSEPPG